MGPGTRVRYLFSFRLHLEPTVYGTTTRPTEQPLINRLYYSCSTSTSQQSWFQATGGFAQYGNTIWVLTKNVLTKANRERWWKELEPAQRVIAREQMWACRHTNCTLPCQPPHMVSKNTSPPCKCIGMCEDCAGAAQSWGAP